MYMVSSEKMEIKMQEKYGLQRLVWVIEAYLISFACTVRFHRPAVPSDFEETVDYFLSEAAELLGEYSFLTVLLFLLSLCFLKYMDRFKGDLQKSTIFLPAFFSFCIYMGRSYQETNSWTYCFGSPVNFIKFLAAFLGMTLLLRRALFLLYCAYERLAQSPWQCRSSRWLFGRYCFPKVFLLLLLLWMPVLILSFPGNLCYDVIGQIEQVIGRASYSAHHPLLHTLLAGGCTELFYRLTGSYSVGLWIYVLLQACMLASALAGTVWWLAGRRFARGEVSHPILVLILGVYVFSPMYSNIASTAIKDVPFVAAFIWYVILLAEVWLNRERLRQKGFLAVLLTVEILMSLMRNNGFYVLFLTGLVLCAAWWKQSGRRERIRIFLFLFSVPVLLSGVSGKLLTAGLKAEQGKAAEMLSLPFQQTARYLQLYRQEITDEEKKAIEAVLKDVDEAAGAYDPDLADPVKSLYYACGQVSGRELADYLRVWFADFFKHPCVYAEAFFAHIYGWFDPQVSNAPRYEAQYDLFEKTGLFKTTEKVLLFSYRLADRITPLGLLQNVGAYTWAMLILLGYTRRKNRDMTVLLTPLLASLLICLASPCFYLHPRYAYPYMFTIPFLYGLAERSRE